MNINKIKALLAIEVSHLSSTISVGIDCSSLDHERTAKNNQNS